MWGQVVVSSKAVESEFWESASSKIKRKWREGGTREVHLRNCERMPKPVTGERMLFVYDAKVICKRKGKEYRAREPLNEINIHTASENRVSTPSRSPPRVSASSPASPSYYAP